LGLPVNAHFYQLSLSPKSYLTGKRGQLLTHFTLTAKFQAHFA